MSSHLNVDFAYDKQGLLDLYINSTKKIVSNSVTIADLSDLNNQLFSSIFTKFPFVKNDIEAVQLVELSKNTVPHIHENNNAVILCPLSDELATIKFYGIMDLPIDTVNVHEMKTVYKSLYESESVLLSSPIAINTSEIFSTTVNVPVTFLMIKVPLTVSWNDLVEETDWTKIVENIDNTSLV